MENEFALGFVAVFEKPLEEALISAITASWLSRFERVEQVSPKDVATFILQEPSDISWTEHLQFRIVNGDQFAWAYLTKGSRVVESSGMPAGEEASLSLVLLTELPALTQIIPDHDEKRLGELEKQGLL